MTYASTWRKRTSAEAYCIKYKSEELHFEPLKEKAAPSPSSYDDAAGNSFNILQGSIKTETVKQGVQLIIGTCYSHVRSGMSFIKEFYGSHVQCFVGGWCASHMYYPEASEKRGTLWKQASGIIPEKVTAAIKKYETRGFVFSEATDNGPKTRRLLDSGALFLEYGDIYRPYVRKSHVELLELWLSERRASVEVISWVEFDKRIFCLQNSVKACYGAEHKSFTNSGLELPLNRLRRLGNIVAVNTWGPDDLRSSGFRSSVSSSLTNARWQIPELARSGTVFCGLRDATPWSWAL
jgi:hypothetical protein